MLAYANGNNSAFPRIMSNLSGYADPMQPTALTCPESGKGYVLAVPGRADDMSDDTVTVYCPHEHNLNSPEEEVGPNKDRCGLNVCFPGKGARTVLLNEAKMLFAEQGIDYDFQN